MPNKYPHDPKKLEQPLRMTGHGVRELLRSGRMVTIDGTKVKINAKQIGRRWWISDESYLKIIELVNR